MNVDKFTHPTNTAIDKAFLTGLQLAKNSIKKINNAEIKGNNKGEGQKSSYKTGKIHNKQGKEIFAGIIDGQVYINKDLIDKYSNKEILDNQLPILNTVLKNLHVYNRLINLSRDQFIDFLV